MDRIWYANAVSAINGTHFLDYGSKNNEFAVWLGRFKPDDELEVIVRKKQRLSTDRQRRYYFGVVVKIISEFTGYSTDETHSILKWKFLKKKTKEGFDYVPSTEALTTKQREEYHRKCRDWGNIVYSLNIPEPNEYEPGE